MKNISILVLVVMVTLSCERGEDFSYTKHEVTVDYVYSAPIFASVGKDTLYLESIDLYEILGEEVAKKVTKATLTGLYIEIKGLRDIDTLLNVTLFLQDPQAVYPEPHHQGKTGPVIADFEEFLLGDFISDRKAVNSVSSYFFGTLSFFYNHAVRRPIPTLVFNSKEDIQTNDNVSLNISFKGTYHYIKVK